MNGTTWNTGMTGMTGMTKIKHIVIALGNFWATYAVGSNFLRFSQPRTTFAILSNFCKKIRFRTHIKLENLKDDTENFKLREFLRVFINRKVSLKGKI